MIIKILSDKERARSLLNGISQDEELVLTLDKRKFTAIITKTYYEIARQLASAVMYIDGFKAIGEYAHKEIIFYLRKYPEKFSEGDLFLFDDLRDKRNKQSYEGKPIELVYLENNEVKLRELIDKLKKFVESRISK